MTHEEKLRKGIGHIRSMHDNLIDLEVQLQMELANAPADSGFTEALDELKDLVKEFEALFPQD